MLEIAIPGFGRLGLEHVVSDYTGTLSAGGALLPGVGELLNAISADLQVHVVSADTFGRARAELEGVRCALRILQGDAEDAQKEDYVHALGAERVAALGNGNNDRLMMRAARLGIAVCQIEGCSIATLSAADLVVTSPIHALELLLHPRRLRATLRF
jgi:soluble P-type ATPase